MAAHVIKYQIWDGTRPVVLNGTANRYLGKHEVDLDVLVENLGKFGYNGSYTKEKAAKFAVNQLYEGYRIEILSITPAAGEENGL